MKNQRQLIGFKNPYWIKRSFMLMACVVLSYMTSFGQMVTIANFPGTSGNTPMGGSNYCVVESIYLQSEINVAMSINRLNYSCATLSSVSNTYNNFSIYMKTIGTSTFASGAYSLAGYTLVYSGPISWSATGYSGVNLTTPFNFTNTPGQNLAILTVRADGIVHSGNVFNCALGNAVLGNGVAPNPPALTSRRYNGAGVPVAGTTSLTATNFRPAIQIGQVLSDDIGVANIYTLGKLPIEYGAPTTISASVRNEGSNTMTNIMVEVQVSGSNFFYDNVNIPSLAAGASTVVNFASYSPANLATGDQVVVTATAAGDMNPLNDNKVWSQDVTQNLYSYKDQSVPNTGGVGFNGGTGDFVAKFNSNPGITPPYNNPPEINEIKVDLTTSGQPYQLGIWNANGTGGTPGTLLWTSPALISAPGTAFVPVPNISVSGDYYVGVRQTGTVNIGFGYQTENPIRSQTFYYTSPTGSTTWTDFAPNSPFRFSIEVQVRIPQPPNCATNFLPLSGTAVTCNNPLLSWQSNGGAPTGYDVYLSIDSNNVLALDTNYRVANNQAGNTFATAALLSNTTYYWTVIPRNPDGSASACGMQSFVTGGLPNCYCIPAYVGPACVDAITQVTLNTLSNNSTCTPPQHTIYPPTGALTTSLEQGGTYTMSVTTDDSSIISVWIDYNQNGVFDTTEWHQITTIGSANIPSAANITVPAGATLGNTLMRVRTRLANNPNGVGDACTAFGSGESEDYIVTIITPAPCSGTPNPGNTLASSASVCNGTTVNFSLQNPTNGTGVSYQWYDNGGAIAGATNNTYSQAIIAPDDFYCEVTCGSNTGVSNIATVSLNNFYDCYCASLPTNFEDEEIYNVTLNGASTAAAYAGTNGCTTVAPGPGSILNRYSNFKSLGALTSVVAGNSVPFTVEENECDSAAYFAFGTGIWIDFNHNGSFTDSGENVFLESSTAIGPRNVTGNILIPANATPGLTGMRVIVAESFAGANLTPCLQYGYGETEDYLIDITSPVTSTTLNLNCIVQSYWDGSSAMFPALFNREFAATASTPVLFTSLDCDSIVVELHDAVTPTSILYSTIAILKTNGTAACVFTTGVTAGNYYIVVKLRNTIETWSASPVAISGPTAAYNFTTAAAQAFGSNQKEVSTGVWAFYSGDLIKDAGEIIDLVDLGQLEIEIGLFSYGYYAEDLNGDGNVDILDPPTVEENLSNFIFSNHP